MGDKQMIEYERNFKTDDIAPFVAYCEDNGYAFVSKTWQNRRVFENRGNRKIISRITTTKVDDELVTQWDFKNVDRKDASLKISQESRAMILDESGIETALSMLETMDFEQSADNIRTRYVYEKDGVTFEIDDYVRPAMKVVALEGDRDKVDQIYQELLSTPHFKKMGNVLE